MIDIFYLLKMNRYKDQENVTLCKWINLDIQDIPRLRDIFHDFEEPRVVVYIRTDTANEQEMDKLRLHPSFNKEEEDSFNWRYSYFHFLIQDEFKEEWKKRIENVCVNPVE